MQGRRPSEGAIRGIREWYRETSGQEVSPEEAEEMLDRLVRFFTLLDSIKLDDESPREDPELVPPREDHADGVER